MLSKVGLSQVDGCGRSTMAAIDNLVLRAIEFVEYVADSRLWKDPQKGLHNDSSFGIIRKTKAN
jgi:hypothetical protein